MSNKDKTTVAPRSLDGLAGKYHRPTTRGELRDKLKDGIECEIPEHNARISSDMLIGWLGFFDFTIRKSENAGWSVFVPNVRNESFERAK